MRAISVGLLLSIVFGYCGPLKYANAQGDFMIADPGAAIATEAQDLIGEEAADSFVAPNSEVVGETVEPAQTLLDFDQPAEFQTEIPFEETQTEGYLEGEASAEQWIADSVAAETLPTTSLTQDLNRTLSVAGGANWLDGESGYAFSAAIGKRLSDRSRFDVEFAHRSNQGEVDHLIVNPSFSRVTSKSKFDANSIMANFFGEYNNASQFTPYLGAGIGVSFFHVEDRATAFGDAGQVLRRIRVSDNDTVLTSQIIGGVAYRLGTQSDLFVEYRRLVTSEVVFDRFGIAGHYKTHNLMLGFRKKF